jgi:anti-sigma regulatory factor (Ser/Thr protein kinase)
MTVTTRTDAEVVISIARDAALVRTARLVAAAVARRSELPGALIEEVRLGVGEACAILIGTSTPEGPRANDMVEVSMRSGANGFTVEIQGGYETPEGDLEELGIDPWALLRGVTDDVDVAVDGHRATVVMRWPA